MHSLMGGLVPSWPAATAPAARRRGARRGAPAVLQSSHLPTRRSEACESRHPPKSPPSPEQHSKHLSVVVAYCLSSLCGC